ncbi:MAG: glycosyl transferase family 2 [Ilumatobacteraceae bacterium]|nr:glycosyl transferase family 2 [Ilumatobacteraceae bacterium]
MLSLSTRYSEARVVPIELRTRERSAPIIRRSFGRPANPTVSVVVPTLNEALNLPFVFSTLNDLDLKIEIVVVDGRSNDDTVRVATCLREDVVVVHEPRKGKGAALQAGFAAANGDIIVMLDSDGSADGREIPAFVAALTAGADFAKGSRFAVGGGSADITWSRRTGNGALNQLVNRVFGAKFSDLCYGYNAFWRDCLPYLHVDCDGFEVETLLTIRAVKSGLRITEVPSYESSRIHGNSNLNATKDGLRVLRTIMAECRRARYLRTADGPARANIYVGPSSS